MSKFIPYVAPVELMSADNKPIYTPRLNEKGELEKGVRATVTELDFLCELTTAPGFGKSLTPWLAADLAFKTRQVLCEQDAEVVAKKTGYEVDDDVGHRFITALDELVPDEKQKAMLFNYVPLGRAVKAQTTPEPKPEPAKAPASE